MKRCMRVVVGAQRSGTTALKYYIDQHPSLTTGKGKEVHFYDNWYSKAPTQLLRDTLYRQKFPRKLDGHLVDVSPSYMFLPGVPERLADDRPDARLVVLLRSPVARAISQWKLESHRGDESLPFSAAIRRPPEDQNLHHHSYLARGLYHVQLSRLFSLYKREQVLAIRSEQLRDRPTEVLNQVWHHFNVEPTPIEPPTEPVHASQITLDVADDEVATMLQYFQTSIERTEELLEWNLQTWLDPDLAPYL